MTKIFLTTIVTMALATPFAANAEISLDAATNAAASATAEVGKASAGAAIDETANQAKNVGSASATEAAADVAKEKAKEIAADPAAALNAIAPSAGDAKKAAPQEIEGEGSWYKFW